MGTSGGERIPKTRPVSVPSAAASAPKLAQDYRLLSIKNGGSNSIWIRTDGSPATASASTSIEVPPGTWYNLWLEPEDYYSWIASTAATVVVITFFRFPSRTLFYVVAAAVGLVLSIVSSLWSVVNSSTIQPVGAYVQVRGDIFDGKTTQGTVRVGLAPASAGAPTMGPTSTTYMLFAQSGTGFQDIFGGNAVWRTLAGQAAKINSGILTLDNGNITDERFRVSVSDLRQNPAGPATNTGADSPTQTRRAINDVADAETNFDVVETAEFDAGAGAANPDLRHAVAVDGVDVFYSIKRNQNGFRGTRIAAAIEVATVTPANAGAGNLARDSTSGAHYLSDGTDWWAQ